METGTDGRVRIDIYSDIVCPWCFVGSRRLDQAIDVLGPDAAPEREFHPFLLHPDAPPEGIDLRRMLGAKYGVDPGHLFARVEAAARESGLPLNFTNQTHTYSTVSAHTLLRHARDRGTQTPLLDALYAAYFLEGRNISDSDVLADVASPHGFKRDEVLHLTADRAEQARTREEAANSRQQGIRGVPVFIVNGRHVISGAQRVDMFRQTLLQAASSSQ